jgi:hypothetical protein
MYSQRLSGLLAIHSPRPDLNLELLIGRIFKETRACHAVKSLGQGSVSFGRYLVIRAKRGALRASHREAVQKTSTFARR